MVLQKCSQGLRWDWDKIEGVDTPSFGYGKNHAGCFVRKLHRNTTYFLMLSAGMAIPQKAKDARPPDQKFAAPVDIYCVPGSGVSNKVWGASFSTHSIWRTI
jgi:hypothetical protein